MTPAEEYAELIRKRDEKHAAALLINARLRAEVASLEGITLQQQQIGRILESLGC